MAGSESDRQGGEGGTWKPTVKILVYATGKGEALHCKLGTLTPGWNVLRSVVVSAQCLAEVGSMRCTSRRWPPEGSEALAHTPGTPGTCLVEDSLSLPRLGTCEWSWFDP